MSKNNNTLNNWINNLQFFISENIKGILLSVVPMVLFFLFLAAPFEFANNLFNNYNCDTDCTTISSEAKKVIYHNLGGSSIKVIAYKVEFGYRVNGYYYTNKKIIDNNNSNDDLIHLIVSGQRQSLLIKYDCEKPYESTILRK
ncbi:MAG: hypothetical protein C0595_14420 [Marinilabiliales bacterium]|nr:MAG: hypothetical protein C0595_14420 [Marinilabiliales bacterium]